MSAVADVLRTLTETASVTMATIALVKRMNVECAMGQGPFMNVVLRSPEPGTCDCEGNTLDALEFATGRALLMRTMMVFAMM